MSNRVLQLGVAFYPRPLSRLLAAYYRAPDHPAKLRILRWIEKALGERRIITRTQYGFEMAVDKADYIQRHLLYDRVWEPQVSELLKTELAEDDVLFDVGANVGYFTCLALQAGVKTVFAFEPDPLTREILQMHLQINGFADRDVRLIASAVSDSAEKRYFFRTHVSNTGQSGLASRNAVSSFEVETETLDRLVSGGRVPTPTILKVDVEGWERNVLRGARTLLRRNAPRLIIFEADGRPNGEIVDHHLASDLHDWGYSISPLLGVNPVDTKVEYLARLRR